MIELLPSAGATRQATSQMGAGHPNEFDLRRIERRLQERLRYRYVVPVITGVESGYRIESPCCSRTIDAEGGVIDVALLLFESSRGQWRLFAKDHERKSWELHSIYPRLTELLDSLVADPKRAFWQ